MLAAIGELRTTDALVVSLDRADVPSGNVVTSADRCCPPAPPRSGHSRSPSARLPGSTRHRPAGAGHGHAGPGRATGTRPPGSSSPTPWTTALDTPWSWGSPRVFARILHQARLELTGAWEDPAHAHYCTVSCPDCLRSYDNRRLHGALDWRLALDMMDLAAGGSLKTRALARTGCPAAHAFAQSTGGWLAAELLDGLPVLTNKEDGKAVILGHPLVEARRGAPHRWQRHVVDIVTTNTDVHVIELSDLYEIDRQPLAVLRYLT